MNDDAQVAARGQCGSWKLSLVQVRVFFPSGVPLPLFCTHLRFVKLDFIMTSTFTAGSIEVVVCSGFRANCHHRQAQMP